MTWLILAFHKIWINFKGELQIYNPPPLDFRNSAPSSLTLPINFSHRTRRTFPFPQTGSSNDKAQCHGLISTMRTSHHRSIFRTAVLRSTLTTYSEVWCFHLTGLGSDIAPSSPNELSRSMTTTTLSGNIWLSVLKNIWYSKKMFTTPDIGLSQAHSKLAA